MQLNGAMLLLLCRFLMKERGRRGEVGVTPQAPMSSLAFGWIPLLFPAGILMRELV